MLTVNIICVGTLKEKYLADAVNEYEKRLRSYCRLTTVELKSSDMIEKHLSGKSYKIALCVEGIRLSSEELADKFTAVTNSGNSAISFVIGGAEGLPDDVKNMCDYKLSFSAMTFPHRIMRIILVEQIYRAFTIINNEKYHK
jgi:Uncharacterized conserved protein